MTRTQLLPGDWAPMFAAAADNNPKFVFGTLGGRYVVLSFLGSMQHPLSAAAHDHIVARHTDWMKEGENGCFFAVCVDHGDPERLQGRIGQAAVHAFWDFDLAVSRLFGVASDGDAPDGKAQGTSRYVQASFVLDPSLRVMAVVPLDAQHNERLDRVIASLPPAAAHAGVAPHAPVLVLPRIFEPKFCRTLIERYETQGGTPSGFMRDVNGLTTLQYDDNHKKRSDIVIDEDALRGQIRARLFRRLIPGLSHAFQFTATRIERYLVACYDAQTGGYFGPHRDNTVKGTAHRKFAVTINLNAGDYEGGDLCFPEFGPRTYRAPTGGAVVFSCSLLHEARPVTRGKRYAFLPFLFDEAGEALRLENLKFLEPRGTVAKASPGP
jgi:predicted 2-oxoglutarate/Fe(II)-dependent dioxygenase YbiX